MNIQVIHTVEDLKAALSAFRSTGKSIAFIPTMGALHDGHISLIRKGKELADIVVSSIYVNKSQFNDASDFENYPRTTEDDLKKLDSASCDIAFLPNQKEIESVSLFGHFDISSFDLYMEGKNRPGHFKGVAEVVYRFFSIVNPNFAVFGEKDYMQCIVIKQLVDEFFPKLQLVISNTVREKSGLAMSSRNKLLSDKAVVTSKTLSDLLTDLKNKLQEFNDIEDLRSWQAAQIKKFSEINFEYFEIVRDGEIEPINSIEKGQTLRSCICGVVDDVRLIDNMLLN